MVRTPRQKEGDVIPSGMHSYLVVAAHQISGVRGLFCQCAANGLPTEYRAAQPVQHGHLGCLPGWLQDHRDEGIASGVLALGEIEPLVFSKGIQALYNR